jgi:hypothetical protein
MCVLYKHKAKHILLTYSPIASKVDVRTWIFLLVDLFIINILLITSQCIYFQDLAPFPHANQFGVTHDIVTPK